MKVDKFVIEPNQVVINLITNEENLCINSNIN